MRDPTRTPPPVNEPPKRSSRSEIAWLVGFLHYTVERFWNDNCTQAAAALTYTSLLALVPFTTLSVALLSAFPAFESVQDEAQTLVFDSLVPSVGRTVMEHLDGFVQRAGDLTVVGTIALLVTALIQLSTIEGAFNDIWHVSRRRPLQRRMLAFWAILTITPILLTASISVSTQVATAVDLQGQVPYWQRVVGLLPLLLETLGFIILYKVIPHRPVRWRDAAIGGLCAGILFEVSKALFAHCIWRILRPMRPYMAPCRSSRSSCCGCIWRGQSS